MSSVRTVSAVLPEDPTARLIGRVAVRGEAPLPVLLYENVVYDLQSLSPTVAGLLDRTDFYDLIRDTSRLTYLCGIESLGSEDGASGEFTLLSPIDLQVVKACGVTFVESMLERLVEERSHGDPARAEKFRMELSSGSLGGETRKLSEIKAGSPEALAIRKRLMEQGLWSQYLEVGLGPDPEVFTKAPILSSVGTLSTIGVSRMSNWSNPEPELVLVITSQGEIVGATLGNDVNLRDVEGRSALLLGRAKDNNRSTAIGPFIRLFDETFTLNDARAMQIDLSVKGSDGFELQGSNTVSRISRPFEELVEATWGDHHQYPDGFVLFTGTLFAPTDDRDEAGAGFTHHMGDIVTIKSKELGALVNTVKQSENASPWKYGVGDLLRDLLKRHQQN
ncbi:fumarylacetoacetate hydrolase [Cryobacterium frigoriphilum]|uniref:Fumarylacetoacetate hydrolase n=1 Tax=Cryobacterium frigoriphilum TaxID=1259150 RepID=A0A4R8ZUT3_9MICO|nr:fumarylacetoacetate hydrolase family protein [Cryobacterium frigoriphilum]TFD46905.1 fumarylacetoacetate hydrolase [Cryobacterium frigoriphilum]